MNATVAEVTGPLGGPASICADTMVFRAKITTLVGDCHQSLVGLGVVTGLLAPHHFGHGPRFVWVLHMVAVEQGLFPRS